MLSMSNAIAAINLDNMNRQQNEQDRHFQPRSISNDRPQPKRGPSGAWSRLKPANIDPLEVYGLPSKGEKRLHDHANQESYYSTIVQRYMKFCASTGGGEPLEAAFASMSMQSSTISSTTDNERPPLIHRPSATERPNDLPNILMAMRKLREGILGSRRRDMFAQRAYIFIIHASILTRQWESYQPALLHLLSAIHPHTPLSSSELHEFVNYRILDLACRQDDVSEALLTREKFQHRDRRVTSVLLSLVRDDWTKFWRIRRAVDGYQRALMSFAEESLRLHALKCIGRSYMQVDKFFLEKCADTSWSELVKSGVGWQLQDNGVVIVRKPKSK